jgi:hypothetical protein
MSLFKSFTKAFGRKERGRGRAARRKVGRTLSRQIEALEERAVPALFGEFKISDDVVNLHSSANATSTNGMSVVVYNRTFGPGDNDVKARLFAANGAPIGGEINVESGILNDLDPSVAMDASGNFVVTWTQSGGSGGSNILARRFNNQGVAQGGAFAVANTNKGERDSDVAMDPAGNFVVSYTEDFSAFDQDVRVRMFSSSGLPKGESFSVSSLSNADEEESSVAMDSSGNFAVAYTSDTDTANPDVKLKRFDFNGGLDGTHTIAGGNGTERDPSLAMDALGNMVIAYELGGADNRVHARRLSSDGVLGGEVFIGNFFGTDSFDPEVALSNSGAYVVAFDFARSNGTRAVRVTEVGADDFIRTGSEHLIETAGKLTTGPSISIDPVNGDYLVSYERGPSLLDGDIFGRRGQL